MTERAVEAAVIAALAAGSAEPRTLDQLRGTQSLLPNYYTEVHVSEVPGSRERLGQGIEMRQWRVITRAVARERVNAQAMRARAAAALEDTVLTVEGIESSPIVREVADDPIGDDDGWWSGVSEWRLHL